MQKIDVLLGSVEQEPFMQMWFVAVMFESAENHDELYSKVSLKPAWNVRYYYGKT